jgi:hypothetical protein
MTDNQKNALIGLGVLAMGYVVLDMVGALDEDDRPPIIVSSGSVNVVAQFDAKEGSRGEFRNGSGDGKAFTHEHSARNKTRKFSLALTGLSGGNCSEATIYKNVTAATITYTKADASTATIAVSVAGEMAQFAFSEAPAAPQPHWLRAEDGRLTRVVFDGNAGGGGGSQSYSCDFGGFGSIDVYQRK